MCCVSFPLGAVVGNGPLMLVTAIGVCLLMSRVLDGFSFFWWLSVGAWGLLPAWGVRLLPSRGCVGVCLVAFVF